MYVKKFSFPVFVVILSLSLQGCITAAVVGTAAISTKVATDPRTIGSQVNDATLELRVKSALSKDKTIQEKARVNVIAYQGKVLLLGQTPSINLALRSKNIAMKVKGVIEVFNEIRKNKPISLKTISSDIWITTKVRSKLFTNNRIKYANVKVVTENSEVFLLGLVSKIEGIAISNIASHVSGVSRVITLFTYVK